MSVFNLPELGEGLEEGEIVDWKVEVGGSVEADHALAEVMTDKATIEIPSPATGTVKKLFYGVGDTAKVGQPLVEIEAAEKATTASATDKETNKGEEASKEGEKEKTESASASASESESQAPAEAASSKEVGAPASAPSSGSAAGDESSASTSVVPSSKVLASPAVRKMAREKGIDLARVHGSGERGRILKADLVQSSLSSTGGVVKAANFSRSMEERIPYRGIRRKIGDHLAKSMYTAVHFTHLDEIDFSEVMKLRTQLNKEAEKQGKGIKLTFLPFYIKAAIAAMRRYPILNSSLDEEAGEVVIKHYYHFGVSVQTNDGLMVAVIRDCDKKDVFEIAEEIKQVVDRARSGKASREDLTGSTITITNPGSIGGLSANPVINYPETVILGMYQIKKRPVVITEDGEDKIVARPMMYASITCDHRVVDGAIAAGFMRTLADYIEQPGRIAFMT